MKRKVRRKKKGASIPQEIDVLGPAAHSYDMICFKFLTNFGKNSADSTTECICCARTLSTPAALLGHFNTAEHLKNKVMLDLAKEISVASVAPNIHKMRAILECKHIEPTSVHYHVAKIFLDAQARVVLITKSGLQTVLHTDAMEEFWFLRLALMEINEGNEDFVESKKFLHDYVVFLSNEIRNDLNAYNMVSYASHCFLP